MSKDIDIILEVLWNIRDEDKFYFLEYGSDLIQQYGNKRATENKGIPLRAEAMVRGRDAFKNRLK